jgi:hypothetical protein
MDGYSWIPKDGEMKNAIIGGKAGDNEPFYVCSGKHEGKQIPGKLYMPLGCCYVASFGKEHCSTDYSFLARTVDETIVGGSVEKLRSRTDPTPAVPSDCK